ncbi:hypothetical protein, partial [Micromonospora parva]|uniref:hypothetical protein n=1 Tax=Micromonospora parva TaxID=1464048 RepID=UPI003664FF12
MTFVLDGRDNLSRVFARAGESAGDFHRRVNQAVTASGGDLRAFTQDANGRLRTLDGRFVSAADAARIFGNRMGGLPPMLRSVGNSAGDTAMELGGRGGGGLGGSMIAVAAIAGLSLLPALGAIVPMVAGAVLPVCTLPLGFKCMC